MMQYIKRMETEKTDLEGKLRRAKNALLKADEIRLDKTQTALLERQIEFMDKYLETLNLRIEHDKKIHGE